MSSVAHLVDEIRRHGFELKCKGPDLLVTGRGRLDEGLQSQLREQKRDVMQFLRQGIEWAPLRDLGARLGEAVRVDGREVTLWGVTARGPIVDMGSFVIAVDISEIEIPAGS